MAILEVNEKWEEMVIRNTSANGLTGTRVFQVVSDTYTESPYTVMAAPSVPPLGDLFPGTTDVYCVSQSPARTADSREVWYVTCDYSATLTQDERNRNQHKNPLLRKASIFWKSQKTMRPYRKLKMSHFYKNYDATIDDWLNTNDEVRSASNCISDPYEPILEYPVTEWVAVIEKNVDKIPTWFITMEDAVNNADLTLDFYGTPVVVPKGCAKVGNIAMPKAMLENGTEYIKLQFEIATRHKRGLRPGESLAPSPWDDEIINAGTRKRANGKWSAIEIDGVAASMPVPLNLDGTPIAGVGGAPINESDIWWHLACPYPRKDFRVLPLT